MNYFCAMQAPIRIELPTIYGMKTVNAYLFLDPVPTLIDCGEKTTASWNALAAALKEHGLQISNIEQVIITHAHVDHIGMAGKIAEHSKAQILVNEYCYTWATNKEEMWARRMQLIERTMPNETGRTPGRFKKMILAFMENVVNHWDNVPAERVQVFPMNGTLNFGGGDWETIYAPGHANMQTCFYQANNKWLIAADMLLRITPTPVMDVSIHDKKVRDKGLVQLLDSYKKMAAMDIATVYPGHYETFTNHRAIIKMQVDRIHVRIEECFALIQGGTHGFMDLLNTLYTNRISMPAMSMLIGYLDMLTDTGRVEMRTLENGKRGYFAISQK